MATKNVSKKSKNSMNKLKLQFIALVLLVCIAGGAFYYAYYLQSEIDSKAGTDDAYNSAKNQVTSLTMTTKDLESQIDATGRSLSGSFMTKDEFIEFLGATAERMGVELNKYTGGDTAVKDGIETMNFKLQLKGDLMRLEAMVQSIDQLGTPYAINSISIRAADEYIWLDRDINKEIILPWMDTKSLEQKKPYNEIEEPIPIGITDIMGSQEMYMYLDISFTKADAGNKGISEEGDTFSQGEDDSEGSEDLLGSLEGGTGSENADVSSTDGEVSE